ncbi:unnamed protein product [Arabis nemorensis]|uniref:Uncharacterized protein n=1 Tax=Arabis nemorensis TaxID=586526 RepID=A0A565BFQ9_9BRAS|nr:unnamed protein product [Arabis nemorensis]
MGAYRFGLYHRIDAILFDRVLEVGRVSCLGKAGAPSLLESHEETLYHPEADYSSASSLAEA